MAGLMPIDERMSELLSGYLDGALSPDELARVVDLLEDDLGAIAEFRRLQEIRRTMRLLPMLDPPVHVMPSGHLGESLSAYLDGELDTTEVPIVSRHLDGCGECRHELAEVDRSRTAVRSLPGIEAPDILALRREVPTHRHRGRVVASITAATAAAAVALVIGYGSAEPVQAPIQVSISDLQSRHTAVASASSGPIAVQISSSP